MGLLSRFQSAWFQRVGGGVTTSGGAADQDDGGGAMRFFGKTCACVGIVVAVLIGIMILVWAVMYFMG